MARHKKISPKGEQTSALQDMRASTPVSDAASDALPLNISQARPRPEAASRVFSWKPIIVAILVLAAGYGLYHRYQYTKSPAYQQAQVEKKVNALVEKVSRHMVLPDSTPLVYEIKDPALLAGQQAFFVGAQPGDQLLVFPAASKAIIYSPTRDRIVNVGPITNSEPPVVTAERKK